MSFAYSSVSGVNDETGVTFVSGYTGPCSLDPAARIRAKSSFHIRDALYALSLLAAESMGLKLNRQFFPGSFPKSGQETVFSLEFLPDDTGKSFNYWEGRAFLRGRSPFQDDLMEKWNCFFSALPLSDWLTVNSNFQQNAVTFCRIVPEKGKNHDGINCRGVDGFAVETELKILICISPPEPAAA